MLKVRLSSLLLAVLVSLPLAVTAAESPKTEPAKAAATQVAQTGLVNLNTADVATLQRELAGIGATKAQAIVAYREEHGDFTTVDELLEVKGIGEATLEKNRDKLSVRIPRSSGHPFHEHLTTDSTVIRPPIPRASGH